LIDLNFLEVETPMLHSISGGASARPFVTHHNALGIDFSLRIAPELFLKRLVVGGMDRVFEINRNFRNEGISTKHNPEFTMLEFYMAYGDWKDGIKILNDLLRKIVYNVHPDGKFTFGEHTVNFEKDIQVLTMYDSIIHFAGLTETEISQTNILATTVRLGITTHKNSSYGELIYSIFEELVEAKLIQPTFISGFPIEVSPLAKRDFNNPSLAARFELFVCGMELANGYTELNDPIDQAERFKQQLISKENGNLEAHNYDHDYILALQHGLPPTVGVGVGIDRLVMLITNAASIKDVILFPTLKPR
jgi:lysyl-tRNA synthetase class 2